MQSKSKYRRMLRGGHRKETGMMPIDTRAMVEGRAIRVLSLLRPQNVNKGHDSILWNLDRHRLDVRKADEETIQGRRLRRAFTAFFAEYLKSA